MKWHYTKNGDKPKSKIFGSIPCVVSRDGVYKVYCWNGYHGYWEDCYAYDYVCDFECVYKWAYVLDEEKDGDALEGY